MFFSGSDRWFSDENWSSGTVLPSLTSEGLQRYLPEIAIRSVKPMPGWLEQHRLRGCRLTLISFADGQLRYAPHDLRKHGLMILLNVGTNEVNLEVGVRCEWLGTREWCVLSPVEESRFGTSAHAEILLIEIEFRFWRTGEWELVATSDREFATDPVFAATAKSLFEVSRATMAATDDAALALMSSLRLGSAFQCAHQDRLEAPHLLEEAQKIIEEQFGDHKLDAKRLAEKLNTSRRNLDKLFASTNTTADKAIWERRLCGANCELQHPASDDASISKIAHRNGFVNETHFTRKYKKRFGRTPSQARSLAKV